LFGIVLTRDLRWAVHGVRMGKTMNTIFFGGNLLTKGKLEEEGKR
jgi:hypothetical protein